MKERIKRILIEDGYPESQANSVASDLLSIDNILQKGLLLWLEYKEETDYLIEGIKLSDLKMKFGMTYPAALLTMDWLIKEPNIAIKAINRGIR